MNVLFNIFPSFVRLFQRVQIQGVYWNERQLWTASCINLLSFFHRFIV